MLCLSQGRSLCSTPTVLAQSPDEPATLDESSTEALRDSLLREVARYTKMIAHLRDSLSEASPTFDEGRRTGQEALDEALEEFSGVISSLSRELSELDLDIDDQTISLRDKDGGGIEINIPDDLGDQISKGISSITQVILSELPDSLSLSRAAEKWQHVINVQSTPKRYRVIGGDAVKIWDDIEIATEEDVRGSVVAVFGDAIISPDRTTNCYSTGRVP